MDPYTKSLVTLVLSIVIWVGAVAGSAAVDVEYTDPADAESIRHDADSSVPTTAASTLPPVEVLNETYGGNSSDLAHAIVGTDDGGFLLVGQTGSFGAGSFDAWLVMVDANGTEEWNRTYGGNGSDSAFAINRTDDGRYVFAGSTSSFGAGSNDAWLVGVTLPACTTGDANADGNVNAGDAITILRFRAGLIPSLPS